MNAQRALGASKQQVRVAAFIRYIDATPNRAQSYHKWHIAKTDRHKKTAWLSCAGNAYLMSFEARK
jgi:hypothetical protein